MDLSQRLSRVVKKDKQQNLKYLSNLIKSDFYYLTLLMIKIYCDKG